MKREHIKIFTLLCLVLGLCLSGRFAGKCLADEGISLFAVARLQEAFELRESAIVQPILIFGRLFPEEIPSAVKADFIITLFGTEDLDWIESAGLYQKALDNLNDQKDTDYYVCSVCGYTCEDEAPDTCPVCGAKSNAFKKID